MKSLRTYIAEELSNAVINKVSTNTRNFKKKSLVAIKRAIEDYVKENEDNEEALNNWAENIFQEIGTFPKQEDFYKAVKDKSDKVATCIDYYNRCNQKFGGKEVDKTQANDVIEYLVKGQNLNTAITTAAKKI